MITFAERLRADRARLQLTQLAICSAVGISKNTQVNYESGKRSPDADYLSKLSELGFDVLFLVTGVKSPEGSVADAARLVRQRISQHKSQAKEKDGALFPIFWHEALAVDGPPPVGLSISAIKTTGAEPGHLRAVPIDRVVGGMSVPGTVVAVLDVSVDRLGGPHLWGLLASGQSHLAEIEFHARSMVLPRFRDDGSSLTLWDDERNVVQPLGRAVWIGVTATPAT